MKQEEIDKFIHYRFNRIGKYFHKAMDNFDPGYIRDFRFEIKKLKVFLHLANMESEEGISYRISKKMKTIYGYLGIIQNYQDQLKTTNEFISKYEMHLPVFYIHMLQKELKYWKKTSKNFIEPEYDFINDEVEILSVLPIQISKKSILNFIDYTFYEIEKTPQHHDDESLNNLRKFMEDIYYNLPFIRTYLTPQQRSLFNEKAVFEFLTLYRIFRDKCTTISLLETLRPEALEEKEIFFIQQMEMEWKQEKEELKSKLISKLGAMKLKDININNLSMQE